MGGDTSPVATASDLTTLHGEAGLWTSKAAILVAIREETLVLQGFVRSIIQSSKPQIKEVTRPDRNVQKPQSATLGFNTSLVRIRISF